ncbi:Transcriptional repressor NrdR [subsurface metagenome]
MKCPFCGDDNDRVIDTRPSEGGEAVRRRRECLNCDRRFTTYERLETLPIMVRKRDGSVQPFDRQKILAGILKACEKRPVSLEDMENLVNDIEQDLYGKLEREVDSTYIGEKVIMALEKLDEVAYVRFASVYRQFKDINQFMRELKNILDKQEK